jgi:low temperature requirement A protein (LtrA)
LLEGRRGVERHASWLELFFDLLFVALFSQLAHELVQDLRPAIVLGALGLFAPAWWAWVSYTVSTNLFGETGPGHRVLILGMMACLLVMIAGVSDAFTGDPVLYASGSPRRARSCSCWSRCGSCVRRAAPFRARATSAIRRRSCCGSCRSSSTRR